MSLHTVYVKPTQCWKSENLVLAEDSDPKKKKKDPVPESLVPPESCFNLEYDFRQCLTVTVQQFIQLKHSFVLAEE
jgi:hypothetical protein